MLRRLAALLLEGRCQACGRAVSGGSALCPGCAERLAPRLGGFCPACGALADDPAGPIVLCPTCALTPPPWDAFAFHGPYDDLLRSLLLRFKFGPDLGLCSLLRGLVVAAWERSLQDRPFDLIVPVPLHPRRLLRRGFNQSLELARPLARRLGVPLERAALRRVRSTTPQAGLVREERLVNLRGAFAADAAKVLGRRALVVDDVATTGATLTECVAALLDAGAREASVLVLARA